MACNASIKILTRHRTVCFLFRQHCGDVANWKRVQGANGKLQGKDDLTAPIVFIDVLF